jgi:hypothetical protein
MSELDDLQASVRARQADVAAGEATVSELAERVAGATGIERAKLVAALRRAQEKLTVDRAALAAAQAALEAFVDGPFAQLPADHAIALLPVRIETRFATDAGGPALLVRVYPDEIAVDDHQPGLTDAELAAAAGFWERVWRAGRADPAAEQAAFVELGGRVGVTRALWVMRATQPDESTRPDAPVPAATPLPSPPVLADAQRAGDAELAPAVSRVLPDRWTVLGFHNGVRVVRADGQAIPDPLPVGPSAAGPFAGGPPAADATGPPLEDGLRWLADFDAALAVGMGIRVPVADEAQGFDRLVVLGVRAADDPQAGALRVEQLLDAQRYTGGLGFLSAGAATNNTDADHSAWTRRPDAAEAFDADRRRDVAPTANAGVVAAAFGIALEALSGCAGAADGDARDAKAMQVALWPATVGYFMETLIHPAVGDATVEAVRELFIDAVRGLGPLPALRVGGQPYGLLPVMALGRWRPAPSDAPRHAKLVALLRMFTPEWLATTRPGGPRTVPYVGRPDADPDQELLDILGRDAQSGSYRLRPARGGLTARALTPLLGPLDAAGAALADAASRLAGSAGTQPRLATFQWVTKTARIRRAPVIDGPLSETDPLAPEPASGLNYLQFLARRVDGTFAGPGARALLFKLATHACRLADADAAVRLRRPPSVVAEKAALEPDLVDPTSARASETMPRLLARPARDVVSPQLPDDQTVEQFVATATVADLEALGLGDIAPKVRRASQVRHALGNLAARPTALLDRLARAALDVCSHRLDAWITAYATRRLADVRALHPDGVVLGGYAWVEDLRPTPAPQLVTTLPPGETGPLVTDPTNAGYIAAPSPTQAATAALLLSGHLNHRGTAGPAADAFAVDLSSDRVRLAKWLLDGVRQGQPLGALLGYRLERGLHDRSGAGLELERFIRPLRALSPLVAGRTEEVDATVEAVEAAAASNVVDGLTLLARFQADASFVTPALAGASPAEHAAVLAELGALGAAADALADLLCAETTYQLASGNVARAAATLDGLGTGANAPPEPDVIRTPRGGTASTHRLVTVAPTAVAAPAGWEAGTDRPRRVAEPRLDAWVAGLLGSANEIRAALRITDAEGTVAGQVEATVAAIGACALDLVYDAQEAFELMVADHIAAGPGLPAGSRIEVVHDDDPDWPGGAWPTGTLALDDALEQGRWIADVVGAARALTAADLAPPGAVTYTGVDQTELAERAAAITALHRAAAAELGDALAGMPSPQADARVRDALRALAGFGVAGARHVARADAGPPLIAAADAVVAETTRVTKLLDQLVADGGDPVAMLQAILGPGFAILPLLDHPHGDWTDALAAGGEPAFLDGDQAAPLAWLQRVAHTRAPVERYLLATAGAGGGFAVAQMPPAARWVGLPIPDGGAELAAGATSILVHAGAADAAAPQLAGLVIDEWADVVPASDATAAVAFQFDEPGARAPQAVLLAVPPELGAPWSLDAIVDAITETADLARIRMVGPEEVPWLGRYLPALYVADNAGDDTLSLDLQDLVARAEVSPS